MNDRGGSPVSTSALCSWWLPMPKCVAHGSMLTDSTRDHGARYSLVLVCWLWLMRARRDTMADGDLVCLLLTLRAGVESAHYGVLRGRGQVGW